MLQVLPQAPLVQDPYFPEGRRVVLLAHRVIAVIPYKNYLNKEEKVRICVLDFDAAEITDCRTGETRPMTGDEINRVRKSETRFKRVA
jgi:hypothetical protein